MSQEHAVTNVILSRRSIRRFKSDPLSREQVEAILSAGIAAPSGKNKQPWQFIVVATEPAREELFTVMETGMNETASAYGEEALGSARYTLQAMRQAPVTILVYAPDTKHPSPENPNIRMEIGDIVDIQSIGAAIQNMILAAWENGIGSLWICDTFAAYSQLVAHYKLPGLLVAAISFGIADENPAARPRKPMAEVVQWL